MNLKKKNLLNFEENLLFSGIVYHERVKPFNHSFKYNLTYFWFDINLSDKYKLLKKNGLMFTATLNRSFMSYIKAIIGAEYILRWLPIGTHDWNKFIKPNELKKLFLNSGLTVKDTKGIVFNPLSWGWELSKSDFIVNYAVCATR